VYAAVVLAQYPLFELNTLFILPALERAALASADGGSFGVTAAVAALLEGVSPAVKCLAIQSWTSAGAVFVTLPAAQRLLRWYGFIGGEDRSCPRDRGDVRGADRGVPRHRIDDIGLSRVGCVSTTILESFTRNKAITRDPTPATHSTSSLSSPSLRARARHELQHNLPLVLARPRLLQYRVQTAAARHRLRVVPYKAMSGWSSKASVGVERRRGR
jgi:hypothetical protein